MNDLAQAIEDVTDPVLFEQLCCDVLARTGYVGIDPQGQGRRDGGKDALVEHPQHGAVVCHFTLRKDWRRKLGEDIATVLAHGITCHRFVFVTSRRLTAGDKDGAKQEVRDRLGATADIFDQGRLRVILSADAQLRAEYFPALATRPTLEALANTIQSLVARGLIVPSPSQLASLPHVVNTVVEEAAAAAAYRRSDDAVSKLITLRETLDSTKLAASHGCWITGIVLYQNSSFTQAEQAWLLGADLNPESYALHVNLAIVAEHDSRGRRYGSGFDAACALDRYEIALKLAATPYEKATCFDNMGVVHRHLGDEDHARRMFLESVRLEPDNHSSALNLASVSPPGERQAVFRSLLGTEVDVLARLNLALDVLASDSAYASTLVAGIEDFPAELDGHSILSRVALAMNDIPRARHHAEQRLQLFDDKADSHWILCLVATVQNDINVALSAIKTAITLEPDNLRYNLMLPKILRHRSGRLSHQRALEHLQTMVMRWPDEPEVQFLFGLCCFDDMPATAATAFQRTLSLDPSHVEAEFNLGVLAEDRGGSLGYSEALTHYQRALNINELYQPALANIGTCLLKLDRPADAIPFLERAVALDATHPVALGNLGVAYTLLGKEDQARGCYQRLLAADPDNEYALANLAALSGLAYPRPR